MGLDLLLLFDQSSPDEIPERRGLAALLSLPASPALGWEVPGEPNLAMALLAASARNAGFSVQVLDNFRFYPSPFRSLRRLLREETPLAVGLSTTLIDHEDVVRDIVAFVRRESPTSKVLLGGAAIQRDPRLSSLADVAVLGEGETALVEILKSLKTGGAMGHIPGIAYRPAGGKEPVFTGPAARLDADSMPTPDWSFRSHEHSIYPLETQRGCPFQCRFCSHPHHNGPDLRQRSVRGVLEELRFNYDRHGIRYYRILDPTFTAAPPRCRELCAAIGDLGLPLRWTCHARVEHMETLAEPMARAGCRGVFLGLESADAGILEGMGKPCSPTRMEAGIRAAKRAGIATYGAFILGFPGETERTVRHTVQFIVDSGLDFFRIPVLRLDRHSPLYQRREELGLRGEGTDWAHRTMDARRAAELSLEAQSDALRGGGPFLGADFDLSPFVRAGLGFEDALAFQRAKGYVSAHYVVERRAPERLEAGRFRPEALAGALRELRRLGKKAVGVRAYLRTYGEKRTESLIPAGERFPC